MLLPKPHGKFKTACESRRLFCTYAIGCHILIKRAARAGCGGMVLPKGGANMAETALTVAVLLMALFGCAQGIRWLVSRCVCSDVPRQAYVVLPLSGHCEDVEWQVRACLCATEARFTVKVIDAGLDDSSRLLAQAVCERLERVQFCNETP